SDDLPEPDRPVITTRLSRGSSTSTFFRLCSRAPRTTIFWPLMLPRNSSWSGVAERGRSYRRGTLRTASKDGVSAAPDKSRFRLSRPAGATPANGRAEGVEEGHRSGGRRGLACKFPVGTQRACGNRHSTEQGAPMAGSVNKVILVGNLGR